MLQNLLAHWKVVADGRYPGAGPLYISFRSRYAIHSRLLRRYNRHLSRKRVVVENIIRKIKNRE